jgi:hypothetical protein
MRKVMVFIAVVVLSLGALGGTALASGGADSGGSGGGGGTSSGGGGGGGGGGSTTSLCTPVSGYSATTGYLPYGAGAGAIWVDYTMKSCSGGGLYTVTLTETDVSGVNPTYQIVSVDQTSGKGIAFGWDNEPLPNDTTYQVQFTVTDASGNVVDSRSDLLTTPKARVA